MAKLLNFSQRKFTFIFVQELGLEKSVVSELGDLQVIFYKPINHKKYNNKFPQELFENMVHEGLKDARVLVSPKGITKHSIFPWWHRFPELLFTCFFFGLVLVFNIYYEITTIFPSYCLIEPSSCFLEKN